MLIERFHGEGIAVSPAPLSQVVRGGGLVYLSGQVPFDADGQLAGEDIETQARQVFDNMRRNLAAAGCSFRDVLKVNAFLADLADAPGYNAVYEQAFSPPYPARTTVGAALPGFRLEVEAVALVHENGGGMGDHADERGIVAAAYEAWDAEDEQALRALVDEHATAYQSETIPWGATAQGREEFVRYALDVKQQLDASASVDTLFRCGADVVALGRSAGSVKATGGRFDLGFAHVWTVRDGLIQRFVAYVDTDALAPALEAGA
jgi:2-iminobutanoate/2-iminopropanoate deaminase